MRVSRQKNFSFVSRQKIGTSVHNSKSAEAQKTENIFFQTPSGWTGEAVPPAEIPGFRGKIQPGQNSQDDGSSSEDLVSEQENEMEVWIMIDFQNTA